MKQHDPVSLRTGLVVSKLQLLRNGDIPIRNWWKSLAEGVRLSEQDSGGELNIADGAGDGAVDRDEGFESRYASDGAGPCNPMLTGLQGVHSREARRNSKAMRKPSIDKLVSLTIITCAGTHLPPISLPIPKAAPSQAARAASPPLDPPHVWLGLYGLRVLPHRGLAHSKDSMVCGTFVLTKGIPPAARMWFTN